MEFIVRALAVAAVPGFFFLWIAHWRCKRSGRPFRLGSYVLSFIVFTTLWVLIGVAAGRNAGHWAVVALIWFLSPTLGVLSAAVWCAIRSAGTSGDDSTDSPG
jgi:hypothetical protein